MQGSRIRVLGLVVVVFSLSVLVGRLVSAPLARNGAAGPVVSPLALPKPGRQLLFVYVGSSRCGPSNSPGLSTYVAKLLNKVRAHAVADQSGFVSLGIARELSVEAGIAHLAKVGSFDEVSSGQGGLNQASAHFISRDLRGAAATPQVVIVERILRAEGNVVDYSAYEERVLIRKVGRVEIQSWLELGAPLPQRKQSSLGVDGVEISGLSIKRGG